VENLRQAIFDIDHFVNTLEDALFKNFLVSLYPKQNWLEPEIQASLTASYGTLIRQLIA